MMIGTVRYSTESGGEGLIMVDQIVHLRRGGEPALTRIILKDGTKLCSTTDLQTLQDRINEAATRVATEQAKACHFGQMETE